VINQQKEALVGKLVELGFPAISTTSQGAVEESPNASFDYLLRAPLWNLTQERIEQALAKHKKKMCVHFYAMPFKLAGS